MYNGGHRKNVVENVQKKSGVLAIKFSLKNESTRLTISTNSRRDKCKMMHIERQITCFQKVEGKRIPYGVNTKGNITWL